MSHALEITWENDPRFSFSEEKRQKTDTEPEAAADVPGPADANGKEAGAKDVDPEASH